MKFKLLSILVIATTLSACTSTGLLVWNSSLKLKPGHQVIKNVAYGDQPWQTLNIHIPKSKGSSKENWPVLIFFYGGSWDSGNKNIYYFLADAFVRKGYMVVIPDYQLYPEARFPSFQIDGAAATAWVLDNIGNYQGDNARVVMSGHSAGAHLGALLLTDERYLAKHNRKPTDIKGFVGLAGPYNFTPESETLIDIFGPPENFPNMQANTFVNGDEPPMLLLHGEADTTVGPLNQEALVQALQQHGNTSTAKLYPKLTHIGLMTSLTPLFTRDTATMADTLSFFKLVSQ